MLNDDLVRVNECLIANKLTLNSSKTEFMLIGSRQRLSTFQTVPSLSIGDNPINQVKSTKSLGVFLDCNLSWNIHIDKLCKKIASGIGALKRIGPLMPPISDLDKVARELPGELYIPVASVQRRLEEVKSFKAPGPDSIPNWLLKRFSMELATPVASIFNASISQALVPL